MQIYQDKLAVADISREEGSSIDGKRRIGMAGAVKSIRGIMVGKY